MPLALAGTIYDVRGEVVPDAKLEIWQTDNDGHYDIAGYRYRAVLEPGAKASYAIETVMPGHYPQRVCQHVHYLVTAPGHKPLITQMYFATDPVFDGDPDKNYTRDPLITSRELVRPVMIKGDPKQMHRRRALRSRDGDAVMRGFALAALHDLCRDRSRRFVSGCQSAIAVRIELSDALAHGRAGHRILQGQEHPRGQTSGWKRAAALSRRTRRQRVVLLAGWKMAGGRLSRWHGGSAARSRRRRYSPMESRFQPHRQPLLFCRWEESFS